MKPPPRTISGAPDPLRVPTISGAPDPLRVPTTRALILHRLGLAAVVLGIEIVAGWLLGGFDPGAKLLGGGSPAVLAVFALGAFFCLRFLAYFVVPPALAVGIVAALLPKADLREAIRGLRGSRIVDPERLG